MKCNIREEVKLTNKQRKVLAEEVKALFMERLEEYDLEFDAMVLYTLHKVFGFGKERLERLYKTYFHESDSLKKRYEEDTPGFPAIAELQKIGVDVVEWHNKIW
jgi:hypothetical protein